MFLGNLLFHQVIQGFHKFPKIVQEILRIPWLHKFTVTNTMYAVLIVKSILLPNILVHSLFVTKLPCQYKNIFDSIR